MHIKEQGMLMEVKSELKYTHKTEVGKGEGMNSTVYLIDEPQLGGELVAKEMNKARFGGDPGQFFREAKMMFASNAPNVVPIQYASQTPVGQVPELVCLCMPYFKNGSLAKRIATSPLSPREVVRVGHGILMGLGSIHAKGFLHFDIKPTNILFNDNNAPMVADFGQACASNASGTAIPDAMYPTVIPPEMIGTYTGTCQSDIYQVGLTLYRAVNGEPLYRKQIPANRAARIRMTEKGKFPDRKLFMPHVPKPLRTVIRKALQVWPPQRYQSAAEMADALGRINIRNDWSVDVISPTETRWIACRNQQPDLIVTQKNVVSGWDIEMHTRQLGSKLRAKDTAKWKSGQNLDDSNTYLTTLFAELESA